MSELTWTPDTARLDSLELWARNPKRMSKARAARLLQSWREMNQYQTLAVGPSGECYDGHQRIQALRAAGYPGEYEVAVMRSSRALTDEERRRLIVESTVGTVGAFDWDELAAWPLAEVQGYGLDAEALAEWNDAGANLALMMAAEVAAVETPSDTESEPPLVDYVPDAIFATDNEWHIPLLRDDLQGDALTLPLTKWGDGGRARQMPGTYHFYTDDYKFNALWEDPRNLINSRCAAIIEPNFSTNEHMPLAVVLYGVYRKRWLARYVQNYGIRVWVDLNVAATEAVRRVNLLGVPRGWRCYATRGLEMYEHYLEEEYAIAEAHAGGRPEFIVYGGGKTVAAHCRARGWLWLPENMRVKEGKAEADYG